METVFRASRYDHGGADYLNCPLSRDAYYRLVDSVLAADKVPKNPSSVAPTSRAACLSEEMARRGKDTLAFGPMKPVGLTDSTPAAVRTRSCSCARTTGPGRCGAWVASRPK